MFVFLVVVESLRDSFERQMRLDGMTDEGLLEMGASRNEMERSAADGDDGAEGGAVRDNVWHLFRSDIKRLFSNAMNIIITVGLVVMPSIFAWYNVIACWNVFDNTGNLTVAVANVDDGYESDLVPLRVNIGEQVVSALRANDEIDWTFTTEEDAVDGARSGRYYAAVVIPHDFSRDMLTFYSEDVHHARSSTTRTRRRAPLPPRSPTGVRTRCRTR